MTFQEDLTTGIAIVGMSGRFPGAATISAFWDNLKAGRESVTFFSAEQLQAAGVDAATLNHPNYVKARAMLSDFETFDAGFFNMTPREAQTTDPQHRLLLECAYEALSDAGAFSDFFHGEIGVFAGVRLSEYLFRNLLRNRSAMDAVGLNTLLMVNRKDSAATMLAYRLNLTGPAISLNTACSTSLVALHLAGNALLNYECDIALAGAAAIPAINVEGYMHQPGGMASPDGHCRPFDAGAQGTHDGSAVAMVALKRLEDALAAGDLIHAVVRGSAVNNDGGLRVGYTAPGIDGQSRVIRETLEVGGVHPETIQYVETHGTATELGDPIEIAALETAYRAYTDKKQFCALGSVKSNVGHCGVAAGAVGLIKTVLALKNGIIPPSLHYRRPNSKINFADSPFYVADKLTPWPETKRTRRAALSSFGIGGTNAHVVLEQAPAHPDRKIVTPKYGKHILFVSAKSLPALKRMQADLRRHIADCPDIELADVAATLVKYRPRYQTCRVLIASTTQCLIDEVTPAGVRTPVFTADRKVKRVTFMFSGVGEQQPGMGAVLYRECDAFKKALDDCAAILEPLLKQDIRGYLFDQQAKNDLGSVSAALMQTSIFAYEYALAKLWMHFGVYPDQMIGHSLGEYVAACLSGVFSLPDALTLVFQRGRLVQSLPPGDMLAVPLPAHKVKDYLDEKTSVAAINGKMLSIISGDRESIRAIAKRLSNEKINTTYIKNSHAIHSVMMTPILTPFKEVLDQVAFEPFRIPFVSNVTGQWITDEQATSSDYWVRHIRQPVLFSDGVKKIADNPKNLILEIGPGNVLTQLVKLHAETRSVALSSLGEIMGCSCELTQLLHTFGLLWAWGVPVQWDLVLEDNARCTRLPSYPFDRQRHWISPDSEGAGADHAFRMPRMNDRGDAPWFQTEQGVGLPERPETADLSPPTEMAPVLSGDHETHAILHDIWRAALGLPDISLTDSFFSLGGNSLLALQIVSRINQRFGTSFQPRQMMTHPTISAFAELIDAHMLEQLDDALLVQYLEEMENLIEDESPSVKTDTAPSIAMMSQMPVINKES